MAREKISEIYNYILPYLYNFSNEEAYSNVRENKKYVKEYYKLINLLLLKQYRSFFQSGVNVNNIIHYTDYSLDFNYLRYALVQAQKKVKIVPNIPMFLNLKNGISSYRNLPEHKEFWVSPILAEGLYKQIVESYVLKDNVLRIDTIVLPCSKDFDISHIYDPVLSGLFLEMLKIDKPYISTSFFDVDKIQSFVQNQDYLYKTVNLDSRVNYELNGDIVFCSLFLDNKFYLCWQTYNGEVKIEELSKYADYFTMIGKNEEVKEMFEKGRRLRKVL